MTFHRVLGTSWLALALLLTVAAPSLAQEEVAASTEPAEPAAPDATAVAEVPLLVERDRARLERIGARAEVEDEIRLIAEEFPGLQEGLDKLAQDPALGAIDQLPLRIIDDLHRRWDLRLEQLEGLGRTLRGRTESLDEDLEELSEMAEVWQSTLQVASELGYPVALVEDLSELVQAGEGIGKAVRDRRDAVAELQAEVASERADIERIIDGLAVARDASLRRLLTRDTRPLWEGADDESIRVTESFADTWEMHRGAASAFLDNHPNLATKFAVLFALGLLLFWRARRRREEWELSPGEELAVKMVGDRPVVTAAIFALFFSFLGTGRAPLFVLSIWLVILATLTPLAIRRIAPTDVWWLAATTSLSFALERLTSASRFVFADSRIAIVVLFAIAGLFTMGLGASLGRRIDESGGRFGPIVYPVWVQGAFLLIASGAVALGWVRLGYLLGGGTLASAMGAWGVYVGAKGTEGVVSIVLREWPVGALPSIKNHRESARYQLGVVIRLGAIAVWLRGMLSFYRLREVVKDEIVDFLQREIEVGDIGIRPDQILLFLAFALLTVIVARLLRIFLEEDLLAQLKLPQGVRETVALMAWLGTLFGGTIISFASLGFDPQSLTVLAGAVGVGLGFGLQDIVKNFAAGIILLIERPVRIGDAVEVGALKGRVRAIGIRSSVIKTYQGADVIVPNGSMVSRDVVNWTRSDLQRRLDVEICVPHDVVADEVMEVLLAAGASTPGLLETRPPAVIFLGSDNTGLQLSLRCWTEDYDNWLEIESDLTTRTHRALREAGIPIAVPRRQVASMALYEGPRSEGEGPIEESEETP